MFEFLIANGHSETDLWEHSPEKIQLFFELANKRRARDEALAEIRSMHAMRVSIASCIDESGAAAFKTVLKHLEGAAGLSEQDEGSNRRKAVQKLKGFGVKVRR